MRFLREWIVRLWASVRPGRSDADIREELRAHLELATERENGQCKDVGEARRAARARAGSTGEALNAMHDQRVWRPVEDFLQDVRYGLRTMRRTPLLAAVVILSLAVGTGAHAALYSLIEATLLRELAVEAPEELVYFQWRSREWFPDMARFGGSGARNLSAAWSPSFSTAAFDALRSEARTLSALFAFTPRSDVASGAGSHSGRTIPESRSLASSATRGYPERGRRTSYRSFIFPPARGGRTSIRRVNHAGRRMVSPMT